MNANDISGPALLVFSAARRMVPISGDWLARGFFYDDYISTGYSIFMPHVLASDAFIALRWGVDLADNGTYYMTYYASNTPKKNKNESASE